MWKCYVEWEKKSQQITTSGKVVSQTKVINIGILTKSIFEWFSKGKTACSALLRAILLFWLDSSENWSLYLLLCISFTTHILPAPFAIRHLHIMMWPWVLSLHVTTWDEPVSIPRSHFYTRTGSNLLRCGSDFEPINIPCYSKLLYPQFSFIVAKSQNCL